MDGKGKNTNRTPYWESAAYEIPKAEDVFLIDSKFGSRVQISRTGTNMSLGDKSRILYSFFGVLVDQPFFATFSVENSFSSCESLGVDKNQGLLWIEPYIKFLCYLQRHD